MPIADAHLPLIPAAVVSGAHMDRRIERPSRARWWRIAAVASLMALAVLAWRVMPSTGSTDIAAGDVDSGVIARAPFADYLPVRANVAPAVTTFVGALSGGRSRRCWRRTAASSSRTSRSRRWPTRRSSSTC